MAAMLSVLVGLVSAGVSVWCLVLWRAEFLLVMKGFLPLCFLMGGIVAVIAGVTSLVGKTPEDPDKK
jgi:hypothetical protein